MVKTGRWLKSLLSGKKSASGSPEGKQGKEKKRWGFVRSRHDRGNAEKECGFHKENSASLGAVTTGEVASMDPEKRAIAVAAATAAVAEAAAAVAEAAAAAAHAAEAVVRLTSSGRCVLAGWKRESLAAIRIQTDFRGYLARRALRALKGLVRLQALVRGRIVRKQIAENLRLMQALVRAQARARAHRVLCTEPGLLRTKPAKASLGPRTPEKHEPSVRIYKIKPDRAPSPIKRDAVKPNYVEAEVDRNNSGRLWFDRWIDGRGGVIVPTNATDDENAKVLEIDPGKPPFMSKRKSSLRSSQSVFSTSDCNSGSHSFTMIPGSPSKDSTIAQLSSPSPSSVDMPALRLNPLRLPHEDHESTFATSENSQQFYSASSRPGAGKHGPFTPLKSEYAQSLFSGYGHYPNYMANTESWRAKARSQSAPKQRPDLDKSGSAKRIPAYGLFEQRSSSTNMHSQRSSLHTKFISKAYPGSGRLDRLGMPVS